MNHRGVLLKEFAAFAQDVRDRVQASIEAVAAKAGRTPIYLNSPAIDKEQLVRKILAEEGPADNGLVAVLKATEVCQGFDIYRNRATKHLDLVPRTRKCLHDYVYWQDRRLGLTQVRIQTWLPLNVHIVLNGREWLSRQLTQANIPSSAATTAFRGWAILRRRKRCWIAKSNPTGRGSCSACCTAPVRRCRSCGPIFRCIAIGRRIRPSGPRMCAIAMPASWRRCTLGWSIAR